MSPRGFRPAKNLGAAMGAALGSVASSVLPAAHSPFSCAEPGCGAPSVRFWTYPLLKSTLLVFGRCADHPFKTDSTVWREVSRDEALVAHVHSS
jgi:hypothetical protein